MPIQNRIGVFRGTGLREWVATVKKGRRRVASVQVWRGSTAFCFNNQRATIWNAFESLWGFNRRRITCRMKEQVKVGLNSLADNVCSQRRRAH